MAIFFLFWDFGAAAAVLMARLVLVFELLLPSVLTLWKYSGCNDFLALLLNDWPTTLLLEKGLDRTLVHVCVLMCCCDCSAAGEKAPAAGMSRRSSAWRFMVVE